jgi:DNA-binding transcriptional regulator YiaG
MITYPHFAFTQLRLVNGYRELDTDYGQAREYKREDELEHCIRRLVVRKTGALTGPELRFLRRGLEISQASFGQMLDRDAQTVARWEKSFETVPRFVDLMVRMRFAERFDPEFSIKQMLSFVDGSAPALPSVIYLTLSEDGWSFAFSLRTKMLAAKARVISVADLPRGRSFHRIDELEVGTLVEISDQNPTNYFEDVGRPVFSVVAEGQKKLITLPAQAFSTPFPEGNSDDHSTLYH